MRHKRQDENFFSALMARLAPIYHPPPPPTDALELILRENIGYLIDEARRSSLFDEFRSRVGVTAKAIAQAREEILLDIAKRGGMRPDQRVERWRRIAGIVLAQPGGDLAAHLRTLPVAKARALLKQFPSIGDPGADKILLLAGLDARPSVDSNGLRVLVRFGVVPDRKSYAATYRAAVDLLAEASAGSRDRLVQAFLVLREHGRSLCKRNEPRCIACPLDRVCAHARAGWF